jgi:hypothetical protein
MTMDYPVIYDTLGYIGDSLIIFDLDNRRELGMSSFTYHVRQGAGSWPGAMWDPQTDIEFYRYLSGSWRDGTRYTFGGSGYNLGPGSPIIDYAFTGDPGNNNDWSMCSASLGTMDPRTVQATGPFRLDPGAIWLKHYSTIALSSLTGRMHLISIGSNSTANSSWS